MARQEALSNALAQAYADTARQVSFHEADPGVSGTDGEVLTRKTLVWSTSPSGGAITSNDVTVTVPGGTVLTHVGIWSTGGAAFLEALPNAVTFDSATTYVFSVMDQE